MYCSLYKSMFVQPLWGGPSKWKPQAKNTGPAGLYVGGPIDGIIPTTTGPTNDLPV